jgi:phage-related protein
MALPTFAPARPPGYQSGQDVTYKTKEAPFGDGYMQRGADGIHNEAVTWSLNWSALLPAEYEDIAAFLKARGGYQAFLYTVPGDIERKYKCKTWKRGNASHATRSLQATFEEVLDP